MKAPRGQRWRYARGHGYRKRFIEENPGPWRCRYCDRRIDEDEMTVDHLVSIARARRSALARLALRALGAETVNDMTNLVPACRRCNSRKGAKGGWWIVRGLLGAHRWYWVARAAVLVATMLACAAALAWMAWLVASGQWGASAWAIIDCAALLSGT